MILWAKQEKEKKIKTRGKYEENKGRLHVERKTKMSEKYWLA